MIKSEFSETQFVIGYTRELLKPYGPFPYYYLIHAPSTKEEKQSGSDLILRYYGKAYKYSEFYQFKRSKFYDKEIFSDLKGKSIIDTGASNKYGFNIYNTKATRQFNVLQKLSKRKRNRVYYCAPLFNTVAEYNRHFKNATIMANSKVFNIGRTPLSSVKIPLDSNHQIIFDRTTSHICSDPIEISSYLASERNKNLQEEFGNQEVMSLESHVKEVFEVIAQDLVESKNEETLAELSINFMEVQEFLVRYYDIYWYLNLSEAQ